MNKNCFELRKNQMLAVKLIPQLEEELAVLRKRKTALKGHGSDTKEIIKLIDEKQALVRTLRKSLKKVIPKSAFALPPPKRKKPLEYTHDAQKQPLQGGRVSPK